MSSISVKSIALFTLKKKISLKNVCNKYLQKFSYNLCKHLIKYTLYAILFSLKISIPSEFLQNNT